MASTSVSEKTFSGIASLIKLLPTGTVFIFQFLNPIVTDNGKCQTVNEYLTGFLLVFCAFSCCFATFTDSYVGSDGLTHYAIVTAKGLYPSPSSDSVNLSDYKLRFGDFAHALFSLIVFAVLGLLDSNTVGCFYPSFEETQKVLVMVLPPVIGVVSGAVFLLFPNTRHGIGYSFSTSSDSQKKESQIP